MATTIEQRPMTPAALERMIRDMAPCVSKNPEVRERYEQSIREWISMPAWQRDVHGFAKQWLADATSVL